VKIFGDESGYFGARLMGSDTVFGLCTTNLDDAKASDLLDKCFGKERLTEVKYVNVSANQKTELCNLIQLLQQHTDNIFVSGAYKPFVTWIKLVDYWIDSAIWKIEKKDFREKRSALAFANLTYSVLSGMEPVWFNKQLWLFNDMMMKCDEKVYSNFWSKMFEKWKASDELVKDLLGWFLTAEDTLGYEYYESLFKLKTPLPTMDIVFPLELEAACFWSNKTTEPLIICHDAASEFSKAMWLWDALTSETAPTGTFMSAGRTYKYPLNIEKTEFIDSKDSASVQICDLIAGAVAECLRSSMGDHHDTQLVESMVLAGVGNFTGGLIWPESNPAFWEPFEEEIDSVALGTYIDSAVGDAIEKKTGRRPKVSTAEQAEKAIKLLSENDLKSAFPLIKGLAEEKIPYFQWILGKMFEEGLFVAANEKQAVKWFQLAVENGEHRAAFSLGTIHFNEKSEYYDPQSTFNLWYAIASVGHSDAQHNLACIYTNGLNGVTEKNDRKSAYWCLRAARNGKLDSQCLAGSQYYYGKGVKQSFEKAQFWWTIAAMQGHAEAHDNLVLLHMKGLVPKVKAPRRRAKK
jgi:hypothetical protein